MGLPQIPVPTLETARKPEKLYEFLRLFSDAIRKLDIPVSGEQSLIFELTPDMITTVRDMLQANGSDPLNVSGLLGVLSQPQTAAIVVASAQPNAALYMPGTMLVVTGSPDTFYYNKTGSPNTWQAISTTPTNMMTLDTAQVVTAAGVKTVDASWLFQVDQSLTASKAGTLLWLVNNTNAAATNATASFKVLASTASAQFTSYGAGHTGTAFGVTLGNYASLLTTAGSGLLIGSTNATPIVFGTNNLEVARFASGGLFTLKDFTQTATNIKTNTVNGVFEADGLSGVAGNAVIRALFGGSAVSELRGDGSLVLTGLISGATSVNCTSVNSSGAVHAGGDLDTDGSLQVDVNAQINGDCFVDGNIDVDGYIAIGTGSAKIFTRASDPNGALSAASGDYCFRTDTPGTANQRLYVCSGGTTWTGII